MAIDSSRSSATSDDSLGVPTSGGTVGLSDARYSSLRRRMLDLINRLHATGVQADLDIPVISVLGQQSAGKSSLIEAFSGVKLPRAGGTCTRCPTECRLSSSDDPWQCIVSLRFTTDDRGQALGQARNEQFGDIIYDKSEVEERVRRAQRAILSPNTSWQEFLECAEDKSPARELTFSSNCISLQISGNDVADLSFCDLPGMIASGDDKEMIENLVTTYIKKPSCIILLTIACETDWENQRGFDLAQQYDPEGKRTIGALTKPDRIPTGEEERWIQFIRNEDKPLENGWFSVKQPDSRAIQQGISWEEARAKEQEFFSCTSPWASLEYSRQQHLGTANLMDRLSSLLSTLITKRLPELQDELQKLIGITEEGLRNLPKPPSQDSFAEILHLIGDFTRDLSVYLEGTPDEEGLLQTIRPFQVTFKHAIRATAPNFIPTVRPKPQKRSKDEFTFRLEKTADEEQDDSDPPSTLGFLANEEDVNEVALPKDEKDLIYIDEVMKRANQAITRELPDHYPFVVANEYITSVIHKWHVPAQNLFDAIHRSLLVCVKKLVAEHFSKYAQGGLQQRVTMVVTEYIKKCSELAHDRVLWLLDLERRPRTLNTFYYNNYQDKFLAHYRGARHATGHSSLMDGLEAYSAPADDKTKPTDTKFYNSMTRVMSSLSEVGIHCRPTDIPKLLPTDPFEPALHIMATVRAYFQVSYKRFVDNVPMAIDHELVLGLERDRGLEKALLQGLGITGADGFQRCKDFLEEPPQLIARREELQKRWKRLDTAKKELMDLWL